MKINLKNLRAKTAAIFHFPLNIRNVCKIRRASCHILRGKKNEDGRWMKTMNSIPPGKNFNLNSLIEYQCGVNALRAG
jgi:hypothetical protein